MKHEPRKSLPRELSPAEAATHAASRHEPAPARERAATAHATGIRKIESLKIEPTVELHRSSSGRNIRLKHAKATSLVSPHGLTPRAPDRRRAAVTPPARRRSGSAHDVITKGRDSEDDEEKTRLTTPTSTSTSTTTAAGPSPVGNNQLGSAGKPRRASGLKQDRRSSFMIHEQVLEQLGYVRSSTPEPERSANSNQDDASAEPHHLDEEKPRTPLLQIEEEDHSEQQQQQQQQGPPGPQREVYQFDLWKKAGLSRRLVDAFSSGYDSAPSPTRPSPPKPSPTKRRSSSADRTCEDLPHTYESARALAGRQGFGRQHHSVEISRDNERDRDGPELSLTRSTSPIIGAMSRLSLRPLSMPHLSDRGEDRAIVRWKRGELIGAGTFGRVYRALNAETGELFALKEIEIRATATDDQMRQLQRLSEEIELMHTLRHEHIVRYKGSHRMDRHFCIFMEFISEGSIASMLEQFGALDENVVRNYTRQIVDGVMYLHEKGIIHRDIKGANVLVTNQGVAKLADFGCSKRLPKIITTSLEESLRSIRGSIPWMAPEVVQQTGHSFKADIWSIGATVIEMATGRHPWPMMTNGLAGMLMIATTKTPPPIPPHLSGDARSFLARCFCIDPKERATASELSQHRFMRP